MSTIGVDSSIPGSALELDSGQSVDRLTSLLVRFRIRASLFHSGPLCGLHVFDEVPGRAFLHVLRRGEMLVRHRGEQGMVETRLSRPTLLLFARPVHHAFINPPRDGPDFTCATLDFDGGAANPLVQSLPSMVAIPLADIEGIEPTLDLLFSEADRARCGSRLLVARLFEVVLVQVLRWIIDHPAQAGVSQGVLMGLADPRIARALIAMHESPQGDWSLQRMAACSGMSRSAFAAAFRSAVGTTPAAYVLDWRLSVAMSMLLAGHPVKKVAGDLAFGDAATLSKAFRRRVGTSPRHWLSAASGLGGP